MKFFRRVFVMLNFLQPCILSQLAVYHQLHAFEYAWNFCSSQKSPFLKKNKFLPGVQLNKPHRSMLDAIRTTIDRELSKRTREFFPASGSAESVGRAWKGSEVPRKITARPFLAKFEFLTPKDLEAVVITSEEHRLGTTSR